MDNFDSVRTEMERQRIFATGDEDWSINYLVDGSTTLEWDSTKGFLLIRIHQKGSTGDVINKFMIRSGKIVMTRIEIEDIKTYDPAENPFGL